MQDTRDSARRHSGEKREKYRKKRRYAQTEYKYSSDNAAERKCSVHGKIGKIEYGIRYINAERYNGKTKSHL